MKNLHLLPTDKPSILGRFIDTNNLFLRASNDIPRGENVNIYITSDEEIKEGLKIRSSASYAVNQNEATVKPKVCKDEVGSCVATKQKTKVFVSFG